MVKSLILAGILAGLVLLSLAATRPPSPEPDEAAPTSFSSQRAFAHLAAIARAPHPLGSTANQRVRDYILNELDNLGIAAEVQPALVQSPRRRYRLAQVENIVGYIPGTAPSRAILFVAHYDSVPNAPGAADDGAAVAALLEMARAQSESAPLANDIYLLFSDAEEPGLLGAEAFAQFHPAMAQLGLVFNFEMRGSTGPVYGFETGSGNGRLIPEVASALERPAASSLAALIYSVMPNNTDFTVFRDRGLIGMNFSVLEGLSSYHTQLDSAANLDPRSLQQQGSNALALARHFGEMDLTDIKAPDIVFFDVLSRILIHYSTAIAVLMAFAGLLGFAALARMSFRRQLARPAHMARGFAGALVALALGPGAVTGLWWLIRMIANPPVVLGDSYRTNLYLAGFALLVIAVTLVVFRILRRRINSNELALGGLLVWALALAASVIIAPATSYLAFWPFIFALLALTYATVFPRNRGLSCAGVVVFAVAGMPVLLLMPPTILATAHGLLMLVGLSGAALVPIPLAMLALIPQLEAIVPARQRRAQWSFVGILLAAGVIFVGAAVLSVRTDARHPRLTHLVYAANADTNAALWASLATTDPELDEGWVGTVLGDAAERRMLPEFFGPRSRNLAVAEAPWVDLMSPEIEVLEQTRTGAALRLHVRVRSRRDALKLDIRAASGSRLTQISVNGRAFDPAGFARGGLGDWRIQFLGPLAEGVELELVVAPRDTTILHLIETAPGLPARALPSPPPGDVISYSVWSDYDSHMSLVSRSLRFD